MYKRSFRGNLQKEIGKLGDHICTIPFNRPQSSDAHTLIDRVCRIPSSFYISFTDSINTLDNKLQNVGRKDILYNHF